MADAILHQLQGFPREILRLGIWLAILSLVFMPLERLFPLHRQPIARRQFGADVLYYYLAGIVPAMLMAVPLSLLAWTGHALVPWRVLHAVQTAPFWVRAIGALLATEVGYYWGHRWAHEVPLLWRFHAVHHAPTQIDFLVSTHAHPVDTAFSHMCSLAPIYILGLAAPAAESGSAWIVAINVVVQSGWGYFLHSNLRVRLGPLEWLIASPAFHHWHHTLTPADKNYAAILPWLDRLFGTWYLPARQWPPSYGVDQPMPETMSGQLIEPFLPPRPQPAT